MRFFQSLCVRISDFLLEIHNKSLRKKLVKPNYTLQRKAVAELIMQVLTQKLLVREALLAFPKNCDDVCCAVAWHALVHFEADEDVASKDPLFRDVQVDFLEGLYNILIEGRDLPENLIRGYNKYHKGVDAGQCTGKEYFWHEMKKNIVIEP